MVKLVNPILDVNVQNLRNVEAKAVCKIDSAAQYSRVDYPPWSPVRYDGIFFTEDAQIKLNEGRVPSHINYIVGTNSYEGTLFWMADGGLHLEYENITTVFKYIEGYHEGEHAVSGRLVVLSYFFLFLIL
jgi:hypothetical protein